MVVWCLLTLTLVDPSFEPRFATELDDEPSDICVIGDDLIAVAIPKAVCIYELTEDRSCLEMREKFKTTGVITSLVTRIDGNLAILYSDYNNQNPECMIQVRTQNNRIVEEVDNFRNLGGGDFNLSDPRVLRSRGPNEYLMAVDDMLCAFECDGDMRWFFKRPYVDKIEHIAFDSQNSIL